MPEVDLKLLPRAVRAELRGLSPEGAEAVGAHLIAAGQLIDTDPQLAYRHAEAARRRAARLPVVREASAETAYAAGEYAHALQEYRALRRMTGDNEYLPVIADCERALGRPHEALQVIREAARLPLSADTRVELTLVEAGARTDLEQTPEAHRLLRDALQSPVAGASRTAQARLAYAFAEALLTLGREGQARSWFDRAADWDTEGATDAADRRDLLDGIQVEFDEGADDLDEAMIDGDADLGGDKDAAAPSVGVQHDESDSAAGGREILEEDEPRDPDGHDEASAGAEQDEEVDKA